MPTLLIADTLTPEGFNNLAPPIQVALFLGALSFAVSMLVCVTAFTRIIIVLSFVRRALTTNEIPPNPVIMGLAVFLTLFVMTPTLEKIWSDGIKPWMDSEQKAREAEEAESGSSSSPTVPKFSAWDAWQVASRELSAFMLHNTREQDVLLFLEMAEKPVPEDWSQTPLQILVPAFVVSELKTAFIMGFCIYIPFLLIDLVVSTLLMSLGMMMMTPAMISTPCKLLLFVLADGWQLISRALVTSFSH